MPTLRHSTLPTQEQCAPDRLCSPRASLSCVPPDECKRLMSPAQRQREHQEPHLEVAKVASFIPALSLLTFDGLRRGSGDMGQRADTGDKQQKLKNWRLSPTIPNGNYKEASPSYDFTSPWLQDMAFLLLGELGGPGGSFAACSALHSTSEPWVLCPAEQTTSQAWARNTCSPSNSCTTTQCLALELISGKAPSIYQENTGGANWFAVCLCLHQAYGYQYSATRASGASSGSEDKN